MRRMVGIARGENEVLSFYQSNRWKAIPKLTIEVIMAYELRIDDEWIRREGNDVHIKQS